MSQFYPSQAAGIHGRARGLPTTAHFAAPIIVPAKGEVERGAEDDHSSLMAARRPSSSVGSGPSDAAYRQRARMRRRAHRTDDSHALILRAAAAGRCQHVVDDTLQQSVFEQTGDHDTREQPHAVQVRTSG